MHTLVRQRDSSCRRPGGGFRPGEAPAEVVFCDDARRRSGLVLFCDQYDEYCVHGFTRQQADLTTLNLKN